MAEPLISKDEFVDCINRLQEANDLTNKIDNLMREARDNIENDFMNGASLQINHESMVIKLLCKLTHDDEIYSDIDYFIYELDYGREYKKGMVKDSDGNEINFSNAEGLYDYLLKVYNHSTKQKKLK